MALGLERGNPAKPRQAATPAAGGLPGGPAKEVENHINFLEASRERFFGLQTRFGAISGPTWVQNGTKMVPKWLQKGSPTGCLILNSFFEPIFNDF